MNDTKSNSATNKPKEDDKKKKGTLFSLKNAFKKDKEKDKKATGMIINDKTPAKNVLLRPSTPKISVTSIPEEKIATPGREEKIVTVTSTTTVTTTVADPLQPVIVIKESPRPSEKNQSTVSTTTTMATISPTPSSTIASPSPTTVSSVSMFDTTSQFAASLPTTATNVASNTMASNPSSNSVVDSAVPVPIVTAASTTPVSTSALTTPETMNVSALPSVATPSLPSSANTAPTSTTATTPAITSTPDSSPRSSFESSPKVTPSASPTRTSTCDTTNSNVLPPNNTANANSTSSSFVSFASSGDDMTSVSVSSSSATTKSPTAAPVNVTVQSVVTEHKVVQFPTVITSLSPNVPPSVSRDQSDGVPGDYIDIITDSPFVDFDSPFAPDNQPSTPTSTSTSASSTSPMSLRSPTALPTEVTISLPRSPEWIATTPSPHPSTQPSKSQSSQSQSQSQPQPQLQPQAPSQSSSSAQRLSESDVTVILPRTPEWSAITPKQTSQAQLLLPQRPPPPPTHSKSQSPPQFPSQRPTSLQRPPTPQTQPLSTSSSQSQSQSLPQSQVSSSQMMQPTPPPHESENTTSPVDNRMPQSLGQVVSVQSSVPQQSATLTPLSFNRSTQSPLQRLPTKSVTLRPNTQFGPPNVAASKSSVSSPQPTSAPQSAPTSSLTPQSLTFLQQRRKSESSQTPSQLPQTPFHDDHAKPPLISAQSLPSIQRPKPPLKAPTHSVSLQKPLPPSHDQSKVSAVAPTLPSSPSAPLIAPSTSSSSSPAPTSSISALSASASSVPSISNPPTVDNVPDKMTTTMPNNTSLGARSSTSTSDRPRLRISISVSPSGSNQLDVVSDIDIFQHRPEAIQEVPVAGANIGDNVTNETSEQKSNLLQPNKLTAPNPIATQSNVVLTVATVVNSQRRPEQTLRRRSSVMEAYQFDSPQKYESNICIEFLLMTGQVIEVETPGSQHIITIKDVIGRLARERLGLDLNMEKYLLKTPGASFLTNEDVPIKSLPYVQNCIKRNSKPQFVLLERNSVETKKIKTLNMEIGSLIGRPLCWTQQDDEITTFRQQMTRIRYFERQRAQEEANKRGGHSMFPTKLANGPFQVPSGKFLVELRTEKLPVRKTLVAFEHDTADEFLARYFEKYLAKLCPQKSSKDFVMKAAGLVEYITGPYKLHEFEYIRQCIMKDIKPELCLVEVETAPSGSSQSDILASVENEEESFLIQDPDIRYDHRDLTVSNSKVSWENMSAISAWDITRPFRFRILGVENVNSQSTNFIAALGRQAPADTAKLFLYITAGLYHGGELLDTLYTTQQVISTSNPRWYEWVKTNIKVKDLPRATRICFTLWASSSRKESHPIAWVNCQLFDYKHELRTGIISLNMWPDNKANPIGTCVQSPDTTTPMLFLQFERYATPVVFPTQRWQSETYPVPTSITPQEQQRLKFLCTADPLYPLESKDKQLLWKYRDYCTNYPRGLAKFLVSVPKTDRNAVQESYRLLDIWTKPSPHDALELLDSKFADTNVREYAVQQLENLTEDELQAYLLQLVQVLKYEPYHDSPLARFLLRHALRSRLIGHTIFWLLKSEIHVEEISERYGLLMEAYLRGCGPHLKELKAQDEFLKKLVSVANHIKNSKDSDRMKELKEQIIKINQSFPPKLVLPLNPRIEVSGLKVDKCKYMDSKKLPLWLVFQNADPQGKDIYVIFKCGDDLRQDMLTLQMIRIMDKLWKEEGLDLCMSPYQVVATGAAVGMIEVVMNAQTTAKITKEEGGGATAALFKESYLKRWLESNNPPHEHKEVIQRFIKSCAGYCVATYVLGIGDRHNDNVMVTKDGKLFHIDFGHFLGNYKKKFGIKRERAPFVFTPDFAYVMGGKDSPDFMRFTELCCKAYNIVRKHAAIFINLFALMLSTGIPELQTVEDIDYLREAFALDHNDEEAKVIFTKLIYESLACKTTQMMNAFHIAVHNN